MTIAMSGSSARISPRGFAAIDPRRHPDVDERDRERIAIGPRLRDRIDRLEPLQRMRKLDDPAVASAKILGRRKGGPVAVMDGSLVVDDQNTHAQPLLARRDSAG
ncbi:hypothetical protein [Sphingomonas sp. 22R3R2A-7]|uniref:hypothetical protein n=1 Tax=Sphingomonas sp. 22R3R2A-7 TaxID=3050230 RepID=UPI002FE1BA6A